MHVLQLSLSIFMLKALKSQVTQDWIIQTLSHMNPNSIDFQSSCLQTRLLHQRNTNQSFNSVFLYFHSSIFTSFYDSYDQMLGDLFVHLVVHYCCESW